MLASLFTTEVTKWFKKITGKVSEKLNGSKDAPKYLFKEWLKESLSTDFKWASLTSEGTIVAADVVDIDSPLPLKKRDSYGKTDGQIPMLGLKLALTAGQLKDIQIIKATGGSEADLVVKLFQDTKKVVGAVEEALEYMFLTALSTGVLLAKDGVSGKGIRADFGLPDSNRFGVKKVWSDVSAEVCDDIENVITAASSKGDTITHLLMDRATFNAMRKTTQIRELYAASIGLSTTAPVPTKAVAEDLLNAEYGISIVIIDRSIRFEIDGKQTSVKPWAAGMVTFATGLDFGELQYADTPEKSFPVAGVVYENATKYTLVSKYSKNDPLAEFTSSQAFAIPVLQNVDSLYLMDSNEAQVVDETAEAADTTDVKVTIWETELVKATVITALNAMDVKTAANIGDTTLIEKINQLSDEQEAELKTTLGVE